MLVRIPPSGHFCCSDPRLGAVRARPPGVSADRRGITTWEECRRVLPATAFCGRIELSLALRDGGISTGSLALLRCSEDAGPPLWRFPARKAPDVPEEGRRGAPRNGAATQAARRIQYREPPHAGIRSLRFPCFRLLNDRYFDPDCRSQPGVVPRIIPARNNSSKCGRRARVQFAN